MDLKTQITDLLGLKDQIDELKSELKPLQDTFKDLKASVLEEMTKLNVKVGMGRYQVSVVHSTSPPQLDAEFITESLTLFNLALGPDKPRDWSNPAVMGEFATFLFDRKKKDKSLWNTKTTLSIKRRITGTGSAQEAQQQVPKRKKRKNNEDEGGSDSDGNEETEEQNPSKKRNAQMVVQEVAAPGVVAVGTAPKKFTTALVL